MLPFMLGIYCQGHKHVIALFFCLRRVENIIPGRDFFAELVIVISIRWIRMVVGFRGIFFQGRISFIHSTSLNLPR